MPELPTCSCVRGLAPYDRLTAIYQAAAELSGDTSLPDALCVAGVPPFDRFAYIYAAFRVLAGDDTLPSQECIEGESFQDQVSRIYQAVLAYAGDESLPAYLCIRGLPIWQQWVSIYNALYVSAGSPDSLTNPLCVNPTFDVLSEVFCAMLVQKQPPELLSATIDDDQVVFHFSEAVFGHDGLSLVVQGVPGNLTYVGGEGTVTLTFTSDVSAGTGDDVTADYVPGDIVDGDGDPLAAFTNFPVTNLAGSVYFRPDGVSLYLRPDGVSVYLRP